MSRRRYLEGEADVASPFFVFDKIIGCNGVDHVLRVFKEKHISTMHRLSLCLVFLLFQFVNANAQNISTAKPWTYWWWMGSAVNKADITAQLEYFSKSGVGGVHIIPIYGVKGYEKENISFLSPQWLEVMQHTIR